MIGALPKSLTVNGRAYPIHTDYRYALLIFEAHADPNLTDQDKAAICLRTLYKTLPPVTEEALTQAIWFLDGGDKPHAKPLPKPVLDWQQDAPLYIPAVNRVAGCEVRALPYLHWWTFLGYFAEVGECLFSEVVHIRTKKARGQKLQKHEREFLSQHRELIALKQRYSAEEQAEIDAVKAMLGE